VVFLADDGIWTAALDGSHRRHLLRCNPCSGVGRPHWSPNGRYIAVSAEEKLRRLKRGVWLMNARTGRLVRRLATTGLEADFSPDGRRLAYVTAYMHDDDPAGRLKVGGGDLYVVPISGRSAPRRLHNARGAVTQPAWAPDGRSIAWVELRFHGSSDSPKVGASIRRMPARGGRPRVVTRLPTTYAGEGEVFEPDLCWQPLP
jgi:Tol biopolymer transport system component